MIIFAHGEKCRFFAKGRQSVMCANVTPFVRFAQVVLGESDLNVLSWSLCGDLSIVKFI